MLLQIGSLLAFSHFSSIVFIHYIFCKSPKASEKREHNATNQPPQATLMGFLNQVDLQTGRRDITIYQQERLSKSIHNR